MGNARRVECNTPFSRRLLLESSWPKEQENKDNMKAACFVLLTTLLLIQASVSEPDYVTNLKKYFNDGYHTGTYYRKISSKEQLESEAKNMLREYLKANYDDIERFFSEWEMTFTSDGPFETSEERSNITEKMTKPDDFMTELYIQNMLSNRDNAEQATKAYIDAFVSKDNKRVALFYLGDGDIMHGALAAGVRNNMDAVFVVFLID